MTVHDLMTRAAPDVVSYESPIPGGRDAGAASIPPWVPITFFCSGFAALVYQVIWQRVLFATFGINIEAVTIVVTAFLVGLGFGSLIGGVISANPKRSPLLGFAMLELSIAAYGFISVPLFRQAADFSASIPSWVAGVVAFCLVLLPTLLMGATLPLLVSFAVGRSGNVGSAVGWLYFVNTAGSALASILAVVLLLPTAGEAGAALTAAVINTCVGGFVLSRYLRMRTER